VAGSLTFETPMLWSVAFVILFTIGGFSGLMLAIVPPTSSTTTPTSWSRTSTTCW
jgi:heme/copper-type cytochrome/quinol oxidase subunit 1